MSHKILAIGDTNTRAIAEKVLKEKGYDIVTSGDGQDGLNKAGREAPNLILMDEKLNKVDGYQVLSELQADGATREIPVILISDGSMIQSEAKAMKAGAHSCIAKSSDLETLLLNIRVAIREVERNRTQKPQSVSSPATQEQTGAVEQPVSTSTGTPSDANNGTPSPFIEPATPGVVSTGGFLSQLERILGGGIPLGSLTLLGGPAGTGKSFFCQHFSHGALQTGHRVAYFTAQPSVEDQARQFADFHLNIEPFVAKDLMRIIQIPEPSKDGGQGPTLSDLMFQIKELGKEWEFIVLDSLTNLILFGEPTAIIPFFTTCKQECESGRTIIGVIQPHALNEGVLNRLRMICDTHLNLNPADVMGRSVTALETPKLNKVDRNDEKTLYFQVDPEVGLRIVPISQVKV